MSEAQFLSIVDRLRRTKPNYPAPTPNPKTAAPRRGAVQPFDDGVDAAKEAIGDFEKDLKKIK